MKIRFRWRDRPGLPDLEYPVDWDDDGPEELELEDDPAIYEYGQGTLSADTMNTQLRYHIEDAIRGGDAEGQAQILDDLGAMGERTYRGTITWDLVPESVQERRWLTEHMLPPGRELNVACLRRRLL